MEKHHADTIANLVREMQPDPDVLALLLGGSLAHGCARPDSDVDVAIILADGAMARQRATGRLTYNNRTLCTYDGYIDGKYLDRAFLQLVAQRGSDPIRYAFEGNQVLFSRLPGLDALLADIGRYPIAEKADRLQRFGAQLLAWRWYYREGVRQQSPYLLTLAAQKLTLFTCRLILTHNELLYPYHKWMLRVTSAAPRQPAGLAAALAQLPAPPDWDWVDRHVRETLAFVGIDFAVADKAWPTHFMQDSELPWMTGEAPIDDL